MTPVSHLSKALCIKSQTVDGDNSHPFTELFSLFFLEVKQAMHFIMYTLLSTSLWRFGAWLRTQPLASISREMELHKSIRAVRV